MKQVFLIASALITPVVSLCGTALADQTAFDYPCCLVNAYDPEGEGWLGIDDQGTWPVWVDPREKLSGPPPSPFSAVTMPPDHWVELQFRGPIVDGPGHDIIIVEMGRRGEQALVFLTDGAGQEYLLDRATALDTGGQLPSEILLDISRAVLPFEPRAVRIVAIDRFGDAPGFDLANVRARISSLCSPDAYNPCPVDGATDVPLDAELSWMPGCSAETHIVYFGTSIEAVDADAAPVTDPPQPQHPNSFDPALLESGRTYYWRIDEVGPADANSLQRGNIWSFTVADGLVIEDFESYNSYGDLLAAWAELGGWCMNISKEPYPVYRGGRSLVLTYLYALPFRAQIARTFAAPQDWRTAGAKSIELFFRGSAGNDPGTRMFFTIGSHDANAVIAYDGDPADVTRQTWTPWRIDLNGIGDVNLSEIEYIGIGLSDDGISEPSVMGYGAVYFDNITLHSVRCLADKRPNTDLTGDCAIDLRDVEELAHTWLDRTPVVYPHQPPERPPVAWYKFDGNPLDSSGNDHHGTLTGDANAAYNDPARGLVLALDGYGDSVDISNADALFSGIREAITITLWQRGSDSSHHTDTLFCSDYVYGLRDPVIALNLGVWLRPGRYNWDCGVPWSFDKGRLSSSHRYDSQWTGRWNHWAFTKDIHAGADSNTGLMNIYLNGVLYDSRTDADSPISPISSFQIGSGWYGGYDGLIDDFRIYNYALSEPEIVYVATDGTGLFDLPLMLPSDLNRDDLIDFADFGVLAGDWLDEYFWP